MPKDGHIKFILPILAISSVGLLSVAMHFQYRKRAMKVKKIIPQLLLTDSGRMDRIERFSHYVARQMGFGDMKECPQLCKLAYGYLTKSKGCEDNIYVYFSNDPNADSLCMKLIEEFDKCILAYFAFHWSHAPHMISQVLSVDSETKPKLKDIVMAATRSFWSSTKGNAVVVEADAFKETDVIYRALNSRGHHHDMLQTAELVHQSSMDAASSLLVTALNEGRDVIMDGTLSWEPFVEQTIAMARNVHRHRYRMGVGYKTSEDGTITENYWEEVEEQATKRRPYRIELVGVVCDAYLAVVRGMRRAILNRRAVRVKSQLTSHKRFANAFPRYCQLVDKARLFSTNAMGSPPKLIGWKDGDNDMLVDPHEIDCLKRVSMLNEEANSVYELHPQAELMSISRSVWNEVVLAPSRAHLQRELKIAIQKIENPTL
ncbi:calmodulin calcium-dependent NAD kinase-like isoform X2 [Magnolia sinica]|uniref:calmodulin calcium-dependent NAD kinase-like isoform X2 n=1 Tax=Magnolia sinica TaxID=86752 RepID=UPI002658384C|nr:calmodulin calcium-dependent NAD kinase-like isoform X2 [Magnolia sinica]